MHLIWLCSLFQNYEEIYTVVIYVVCSYIYIHYIFDLLFSSLFLIQMFYLFYFSDDSLYFHFAFNS